jgi:hypothetical protein
VAGVPAAAVTSVAVPAAAAKAKNRFLLTIAPFGPHGGIVGRPDRAALIPRRYLRPKRATR